ncbi:hypothetical protein BCV70DRAFT_157681 [Testicularia cyperi]|uniref:Sterol regulatory element-binding protein cleavage-activating protein n=1 Tax=Testicularia cyperi TaxID=1882483 RepID=A0A317XVP8_9BASI|nr:hypothetical protein BCV70DRAFT_157681 [Testicularia cyperi]
MTITGVGSSRRQRRPRRPTPGSGPTLPFLRHLRSYGEQAFRNHGRWISRHQIRTLLLCSLVITSLFYPAVGIYFWASKGGPGVARGDAKSVWRSLSTPFMDSFASSGRKHVNSLSDLRMIWDDARDLRAMDVRDTEAIYRPDWDHGRDSSSSASLAVESAVSRPRCQSVRVEHVLITTDDVMSGHGPRFGVLDRRILQSALQLQNLLQVEARHMADEDDNDENQDARTATDAYWAPRCVRARKSFPGRPDRSLAADVKGSASQEEGCLVLSPLEYWDLDHASILSDDHPALTVAGSARNRTSIGVPLSVPTTLAGRWHLFKRLPRAEYIALTFFLIDRDRHACLDRRQKSALPPSMRANDDQTSPSHAAWLHMLQKVTGGQVGLIPSQQNISHELVLQFLPQLANGSRRSSHLLLAGAYVLVLIYISRGLVKLRKVHSRFGLAFTGTTQLLISMIMSISICALLGIRLSLVPWELLPFVIVVVGTENMFSLTKAIIDTPISLPVSSRIALGLSKTGVSITLTTLADILLLLVIAIFIGVRAVREFCVFAIFSLMMDWFLQMTFFVTVLSIDMQRLELADLLTQGSRQRRRNEPDDLNETDKNSSNAAKRQPVESGNVLVSAVRAVWHARTARTASLTLLLVYLGGLYLYYGTGFPAQLQESFVLPDDWNIVKRPAPSDTAFDPFAHLDTVQRPLPWWVSSPSADLWNSLNPHGAREVKITVEPWTILSLRSLSATQSPPSTTSFAGWALFRPRIRAVIWFAKLVVLPISGTTALLWMLLLYLLKDTELLDAQRDKSEADATGDEDFAGSSRNTRIRSRLSLLSNVHGSDVELMAEQNGLLVTVDTDGLVQLWRQRDQTQDVQGVGRGQRLQDIRRGRENDSTSVMHIALAADDGWVAIGLASGRICFVSTDSMALLWDVLPSDSTAPISHLALLPGTAVLVSAHRDGRFYLWNLKAKKMEECDGASPCGGLTDADLWKTFVVQVPQESAADPAHNAVQPLLLGSTSLTGRFVIRSISSASGCAEILFRLPEEYKGQVRSALLYGNGASHISGSAAEVAAAHSDQVLVLGFTDGKLRQFDSETCELLGVLDLDNGPITSVRAACSDDPLVSILSVETPHRVSLVMLSGGNFGTASVEHSGSVSGSLNAFSSGSPVRIRTPNGSRPNAGSFWAGGSTPPSPSSELGNPLAYPMSSHGSASRLRRASAHTRDRNNGVTASESTSSAILGGATPSTSTSPLPPPTIRFEDRQLRLLGWIRSHRGGHHVACQGALLIGVCRSGRSGMSMPRWECWTIDLRRELVMGRGGELIISREPLHLDTADVSVATAATSPLPFSRIRFAVDSRDGLSRGLAFAKLSPVRGWTSKDGRDVRLAFAFGASLGCIQHAVDP